MGKKPIRKRVIYRYEESFKRDVVEYFLKNKCTKREAWEHFTGMKQEHGQIIAWMRKLGYTREKPISHHRLATMPKNNVDRQNCSSDLSGTISEKRINELELQLKNAELKLIAYSKMIDIAEQQFKIPIRKKYNTKP